MNDTGTKPALLVDARDAARMLAVSPTKLWAMTFEETPGLPHVRCGRLVRYSPEDLQRWIDSRREGASHANESPLTHRSRRRTTWTSFGHLAENLVNLSVFDADECMVAKLHELGHLGPGRVRVTI